MTRCSRLLASSAHTQVLSVTAGPTQAFSVLTGPTFFFFAGPTVHPQMMDGWPRKKKEDALGSLFLSRSLSLSFSRSLSLSLSHFLIREVNYQRNGKKNLQTLHLTQIAITRQPGRARASYWTQMKALFTGFHMLCRLSQCCKYFYNVTL